MSHLPSVYRGSIPGGVRCGTSITLEGKVNSDSNRFDIELKSSICGCDIPLHSSFRFNEGCVVRNHRQSNHGWGCEEREGGMPLFPGQNFTIHFKIHSNAIFMTVNGNHLCSFNHRHPMCSISCVAVYGGAIISSVKFC